ncbi:type VI secretion system lipoprotein TssJ [Atlantibacter sp. RC6]|uniref:type VI secretion system lipoprotein TssJ n=1 Tax=Atlantibacter sp. RC6 TaxID=2587036 RepID=UPI0016064F76|nr:type VI secretion system lipoprotein TssJ [Atlantibacter sp. RC6]MBB3324704.1 type VI secretion system protein VasD [Atlantibacter sp. RC6]
MSFYLLRFSPFAVALCVLTLFGCSMPERNSASGALPVTISASKSINPNAAGKATSVSMTLYELRDTDNFNSSDFFTFLDASDPSLTNDISKIHEYILRPGETRTFTLKPAADVNAIGVIAAFREIDKAEWRDIYQITPPKSRAWYHLSLFDSEKKINIQLDKTSIIIDEVN